MREFQKNQLKGENKLRMEDFMDDLHVPDHIIQEKDYNFIKNKKRETKRRKKKRNKFKKQNEIKDFNQIIDLHRHTISESLIIVQDLLKSAENKGLRLQVITGRGNHTPNNQSTTIREEVIKFLMGPGSKYIVKYNFVHNNDGSIEIITK